MSGTTSTFRRLPAPVVVGALLIASVIAALVVWSAEREDAERANEALARQVAGVAERTVELTGASLRGAEGVLRRSGPMPARGFRIYSRDIVANTPLPFLQWVPRVPAGERRQFERTVNRSISETRAGTERNPHLDLRPVERRNGSYLPIRLVNPKDAPQREFVGLDLLSEPIRGAAVRAARDSGMPMITGPLLTLAGSQRGINVFDPVYQPGEPSGKPSERRLALRGLLGGAIPAANIQREIGDQLGSEIELAIYDDEVPLIENASAGGGGETVEVDVLGRPWTVWVADIEEPAILPPVAVGGVGVILAALVAALFALAGRREQLLSRERDVAAAEAAAERETAATLQEALLPPSLPEIPGIEAATAYRPGAAGLEIGGDFYDLFENAEGRTWTASIGDVSGKGAPAAALTALVRHTIRAFAEHGPATTAVEVNRAILREERAGTFATLCTATVTPKAAGVEVTIAVAGHPPPLVVRREGGVESIAPTAPLVGVMDEIEVEQTELALGPGDTLFLYTDGLTEARTSESGLFGEDRLREALAEAPEIPPEALIAAILERAAEFAPGFPDDDVAILAIRPTA